MGPFELLQKIVEVFECLHISYLVTGSVAAMAYGESRLTNDIDIVADVKEQHIPDLLNAFPIQEFYISEEMIVSSQNFMVKLNFNLAKLSIHKDLRFDKRAFTMLF